MANVQDSDRSAARATLLALRAIVSAPTLLTEKKYVIRPDASPVTEEVAIDLLLTKERPVECTARNDAGVLVVDCQSASNTAAARGWHALVEKLRASNTDSLRRLLVDDRGEARLLLEGAGDQILFSFPEYVAWRRNYKIAIPHSMVIEDREVKADAYGPRAVIRVGPPHRIGVTKMPSTR